MSIAVWIGAAAAVAISLFFYVGGEGSLVLFLIVAGAVGVALVARSALWMLWGRRAAISAASPEEQAMARAMCAVAAADGVLARDELMVIRRTFDIIAKKPPPPRLMAALAESPDSFHDLSPIGALTPRLSEDARIRVLQCAAMVSMADGSMGAEEMEIMRRIAVELQLSQLSYAKALEEAHVMHSYFVSRD